MGVNETQGDRGARWSHLASVSWLLFGPSTDVRWCRNWFVKSLDVGD